MLEATTSKCTTKTLPFSIDSLGSFNYVLGVLFALYILYVLLSYNPKSNSLSLQPLGIVLGLLICLVTINTVSCIGCLLKFNCTHLFYRFLIVFSLCIAVGMSVLYIVSAIEFEEFLIHRIFGYSKTTIIVTVIGIGYLGYRQIEDIKCLNAEFPGLLLFSFVLYYILQYINYWVIRVLKIFKMKEPSKLTIDSAKSSKS